MANLTRKERFSREFGAALRAARQKRNMSLRDLERASGVQYANISRMESGAVTPRLDTAARLAAAVQTKLASLLP